VARSSHCLLLLALSGCGPLSTVEFEIPDVCKSFDNQAFEAAPVSMTATIAQELTFDVPAELAGQSEQLEAQVHLVRLDVAPRDGVADLSFVEAARLELLPPAGSQLPNALLGQYQRTAGAATEAVSLRGESINLVPYLTSGPLHLAASFTGRLPTKAWHADLKVCASFGAKYHVLQ
jgi:hypothetical protein